MISIAAYVRWEIVRWLSVNDPEFLRRMESAE
ncbi:hypothetical protein J2T22_000618 [Pseudarthrobacter defluvii]|uniref:Uncharacterized protein n=1 Tax=Pseudarthrobacter defluvii TaxID=410837 RepID=A0ABT9UCS4_9MICC|nr:hypothetical protein [Pseudarthrobacter defluvii]